MKILIPDLSKTTKIDPISERFKFEINFWENHQEIEGADHLLTEHRMNQRIYEKEAEWRPQIEIGYLPPVKITEIKTLIAQKYKEIENTNASNDDLLYFIESDREMCKWGVKDWNLQRDEKPIEFMTKDERCRGRTIATASEDVIDILESMDWLRSTAKAILDYNTLDDDIKKK